MAYQLFAKGKEITAVTAELITSTSQFSNNGDSNIVLSGLSLTGYTATLTNYGAIKTFITINGLTPGQEYNFDFSVSGSAAIFYFVNTNGVTNPFTISGGYTGYSSSPLNVDSSFIATETTAQIKIFLNGAFSGGSTYTVSSLSVRGSTTGFNGITELDVIKGSPFTLDFNFKDIKDLKSKGSHSYNFRLPSSTNNDSFFGSYFKVGSYYSDDNFSFNPFGMAECYVLKDTLEVFKGNMQLTNIYLKDKNRYEYECIIFSSEVSFIDVLKGVKFADFDYNAWNHELTNVNVYNSYNSNGISNGDIVYSLWDYGIGHASNEYINYFGQPASGALTWTTNSFDIRKLRPQVKLKSLIDMVFDMAGYQYNSEFFGSTDFGKIYQDLNYNKTDSIYTEVAASTYNTTAQNTSTQSISNSQGSISQRIVEFPNEISDATNQWNNTNSYWTVQVDGSYSVTISGTITPSLTPAETNENIAFQLWNGWNGIEDNETEIDSLNWVGGNISVPAGGTDFSVSVTLPMIIASNSPSKRYRISLWCGNTSNNVIGGSTLNWNLSNMNISIQANSVNSSTTNLVFINNLFGSLTVSTWWKSIITKFNLVTIPDSNDPTILKIEPYNDYVDTGDSKDWSDKVDYTKDIQVTPPTKFCGKQVKFKDAPSNDYIYQSYKRNPFNDDEPTFGEYIEAGVRNQFAEKDTEFTSIFVPTINYPLNNGALNLGVYSCAIWNVKENGEKENTGGIRLSFFHGTKALPNQVVYRLSETGSSFGGIGYSNFPFFSAYSEKDFTDGTDVWSLNWQETLTSPQQDWDALPSFGLARKFWKDYVLDNFNVNSRMITAYIRLNPKDISDFSFADTIQLMGQNYRVNSIKGYPVSSSGNSKVELLLVNKSTFIPSPPINTGGGIITGENQLECDFIFHSQLETSGILQFTTSTNSSPSYTEIGQECCTAMGYSWLPYEQAITPISYCFMTVFPDLPDNESEIRNSNYTNNGSNYISGTGNNSDGARNDINGTLNTIGGNSFNNKIDGDTNTIGRGVTNSFIFGNDNLIGAEQVQIKLFGETLQYTTIVEGGRISGNYGKLMITGDDVIANGISTSPIGTRQKGNFVLNFAQGSSDSNVLLGQYGVFTLGDYYNTSANLNGFKFAGKSNIKLSLELVGITTEDTNKVFKSKAIINQTILISNYTNPIIIYSNVDSSEIDTVFGTTTIECYSLSKPPYYNLLLGGAVAFKVSSSGSKEINWTLGVKYETTILSDLRSPSISNPTKLSGNVLWLDASNQSSIILVGNSVTRWNDVSGTGNVLSQGDATYKPIYRTDDWQRPYIEFDGGTAILSTTDSDLLDLSETNNTFIAVYKSDIPHPEAGGQTLMGINGTDTAQRIGLRINANDNGGGGNDSINFSSQSTTSNLNDCHISSAGVTNLSIAIGRRDGVNVKLFDGNGNTDTATNGADNSSVNRFCVGGSSTDGTTDVNEFDGRIHELICYNRALTDSEVDSVITYLKNKWNIL